MDDNDKVRLAELSNNSGKTSNEIIIDSLMLLSKKEQGNKRFFASFIASLVISFLISLNQCSISVLEEIGGQFNNIVLAIFSISFTAHSIYQALLSPKLIYTMVRGPDDRNWKISSFTASNNYFICYMMLSFIIIVLNLAIFLAGILIPSDWNLLNNVVINDILFTIVVTPYFYCCVSWILEMKSVISNISNIYYVSATDKYIDELKEKNKND